MAHDTRVSCEPSITEMNRTLNLSSIMEDIDVYSKKQKLHSKSWFVDNLKFNLQVYPKNGNEDGTAMGIYLKITSDDAQENKHRKVQFTMKYGDESYRFINTIDTFNRGRGWSPAVSHLEAEENPIIHFNIKLYHYPFFIKLPSQSYDDKIEKLHLMSQLHGD
eukprot:348483_1